MHVGYIFILKLIAKKSSEKLRIKNISIFCHLLYISTISFSILKINL